MKNYYDLDAKGKFRRTIIAVPVSWILVIAIWAFVSGHFQLGTSWLIKFVIAVIVLAIVSVWQLYTIYTAWKREKDESDSY